VSGVLLYERSLELDGVDLATLFVPPRAIRRFRFVTHRRAAS
jgi:hypothetical protein